ncbi:MAG: hypothetical protein COV34_02890 [Candidatus Zambryskibacteria bacterium CG10_big_fil_rev_8_21_14_0_10_42_12]|uniref:Uncharacterized protein n=1 Tax=Candidatus Zambryskibacteria bacterium CG10_big_fil_rev_8_21_14_0_10_42_12 TaxID=1975115 RepID=A0A2H0QUP1_9BACT|nr:MAG: hypothetical protein COV34_02890 [Candidatus Zambryskibacteria bacterium CG10_big_fil_rev_8_21_14_0_10_42_12]
MIKTIDIRIVSVLGTLALVFALAPTFASAAPVEKTDGFVCPVIKTDAVLNSPKGAPIGEGHYTIIGPNVSVPVHATNGDGAGSPGGPHSEPGDTDYTAVWSGQ